MSISRILEPLLLGTVANLSINFIFNPDAAQFVFEEYVVAFLLSVFITEVNRFVDLRLEKKFSWNESPGERFGFHLFLIFINLFVCLNVLGNAYLWIAGKGFFSAGQIIIINIVMFGLALLMTITNWAVYFYFNWRNAEALALDTSVAVENLRREINKQDQRITLQKGTSKVDVESNAIRLVKIESGTVRLYTSNGSQGVFPGTFNQLYSQLPEHLFFPVTRNVILHRELIESVSSDSFGKVKLTTSQNFSEEQIFIVSRLKAAEFRKWWGRGSKF